MLILVVLFPKPAILTIFGEFASGLVTVILESLDELPNTKILSLSISSPEPTVRVYSPEPSAF